MQSKKGHWTGKGYSEPLTNKRCIQLGIEYKWWKPKLYQYHADIIDPLTYHASDGNAYRPIDGCIHNMGSIPRLLQVFPCFEKDRYADEYTLHDCGYKVPHKIMRSIDGGETWKRITVTQQFMDDLLEETILAAGGWEITAKTISNAVRIFGAYSWKTNKV